MEFKFNLHAKGYLRTRESTELEYKESFHVLSLPFYLRTLAEMANNKGGQIIFGVKNTPHILTGLQNNRFIELDPAELSRQLLHYFEPAFDVHIDVLEFNGKQFGQLWVAELESKPAVCKTTNDKCKLREAAIYFRYRGETKEIAYPELMALLKAEKEKEQKLWMQHVEKISAIGPRNVHLLNAQNGEISIGPGKLVLDEAVLKTINIIKEGKLVEKEGAPAFVIKGEVSGIDLSNAIVPSDELYPLFAKDLCAQLGLNQHEVMCILKKLKIKGDSRYHASHKISSRAESHKYAKKLVPIVQRYLSKDGFLRECLDHHRDTMPKSGGRKPRRRTAV